MANLQDTYLKELFESMPVGVLVADNSAFYVDANSAACQLFGRSRSELIGHHLSEFVGAQRDEVNIQWDAFLRDSSQCGVFAVNLPDGSSRAFSFQAKAHFVQGLHCSLIVPVPAKEGRNDDAGHLTMCAWSKRVRIGEQWVTIEDYLTLKHGLSISHGISPDVFNTVVRSWFPGDEPRPSHLAEFSST